jgi:rod shape-determining protein MreB
MVRPLRDGVIADFVAAEAMLRHFIQRSKRRLGFGRPRILICVPAGATQVERKAVYDTAVALGARKVFLIAEPVAASLGAKLMFGTGAAMVVDIGGGTTDIAVLWGGNILSSQSLRCAGYAMDEAIIRYVRRRHHLTIGEASAERIKIEAGTALVGGDGRAAEVHIRGRDVRTGLAKSAVLTSGDIAEALADPVEKIADFVEQTLEELPPDVLSDLIRRGIHLTGGGALLDQLDAALTRRIGVRFHVEQNPMHCVVKGAAAVLAGLEQHSHQLMRA